MPSRRQNIYLCKFKAWEVFLLVLSAIVILWCACLSVQRASLAAKLVRLHVVAASDDPADQGRKSAVRNAVLAEAQTLLSDAPDAAGAEAILGENLEALARAGAEALAEVGCGDAVTVSLEERFFPTKYYDGFALPAGRYRALRVEIGPGEGHNWWCVVFPSLCVSAASEWRDVAAAGGLSGDEIALMEDTGEVELRFKTLEWLGELERWLGSDF